MKIPEMPVVRLDAQFFCPEGRSNVCELSQWCSLPFIGDIIVFLEGKKLIETVIPTGLCKILIKIKWEKKRKLLKMNTKSTKDN